MATAPTTSPGTAQAATETLCGGAAPTAPRPLPCADRWNLARDADGPRSGRADRGLVVADGRGQGRRRDPLLEDAGGDAAAHEDVTLGEGEEMAVTHTREGLDAVEQHRREPAVGEHQ